MSCRGRNALTMVHERQKFFGMCDVAKKNDFDSTTLRHIGQFALELIERDLLDARERDGSVIVGGCRMRIRPHRPWR